MPDLYIINLHYKASLEMIDKHMQAHLDFLKVCYTKKIFIVSGRKDPRTGGIIIAQGLNLEQMTTLMQQDPFVKQGLAELNIIKFSASQTQPEFAELLNLNQTSDF